LIEDREIDYEAKYERSSGGSTCQDAASIFYKSFEGVGESGLRVLDCFLNELKGAIDEKFGVEYWGRE
jgi:hypothetical protein